MIDLTTAVNELTNFFSKNQDFLTVTWCQSEHENDLTTKRLKTSTALTYCEINAVSKDTVIYIIRAINEGRL